MKRWQRALAFGIASLLVAVTAAGERSDDPGDALMELSLEELGDLKITIVSKREESLSSSAAAVYVVTREDMRRSGYTSVAEALRMVPGMQVARENAQDWAIGVRGFNTGLSNKLLVLIDGRSVYSQLFSGVFWELRDVAVEDIERIEVIRGPGAALWGANAVNGVINIITRRAAETAGWTLRAAGGDEERAQGLARYGGALGENADYRISARGVRRDSGHRRGAPSDKYWMSWLQGRSDWAPTDDDEITFQGEVFGGEFDQTRNRATLANPQTRIDSEHGARLATNGLARWQHQLEGDSDVTLQLWYEYTDFEFTTLRERRHTVDADLQHRFALGKYHQFVWGGSYRFSRDQIDERGITTLDPDERSLHGVNAFVQDQIALWPKYVTLNLGSKFSYNQFTGFEVQPSARLAITPNDWNTVWVAVSRAVRTPTRLESDALLGSVVVPAGFPAPIGDPTRPALIALVGNRGFRSEEVLAYELGYRIQPNARLRFDVAAFYNDYEDLLTIESGRPAEIVPASNGNPSFKLIPFVLANELRGYSYGGEVAAWWQVMEGWRLHAWYAYLDIQLEASGQSLDRTAESQEDRSPEHQAFLRSSFDLPHDVQFDAMVRYVARLPATGLDDYFELDLRLAWQFAKDWEISLVGQNLLHDHHAEVASQTSTGVERGVYAQLVWRWNDAP